MIPPLEATSPPYSITVDISKKREPERVNDENREHL